MTWRSQQPGSASVFGGAVITGWEPWRDAPRGSPIWRSRLPVNLVDSKGRARFHSLVEGERSVWLAREPDYGSGWLVVNDSSFTNTGFAWTAGPNAGGLPPQFDCENSSCFVNTRAGYGSNIRPVTLSLIHI